MTYICLFHSFRLQGAQLWMTFQVPYYLIFLITYHILSFELEEFFCFCFCEGELLVYLHLILDNTLRYHVN